MVDCTGVRAMEGWCSSCRQRPRPVSKGSAVEAQPAEVAVCLENLGARLSGGLGSPVNDWFVFRTGVSYPLGEIVRFLAYNSLVQGSTVHASRAFPRR